MFILYRFFTQNHCFGGYTEAESSAASKKLFKQYVFGAFMSANLDVYCVYVFCRQCLSVRFTVV